jgi:hypothetical protein
VDLIFNPILDTDWTGVSNYQFNPALRIAYNLSPQWTFATEHYAGYGALPQFVAVDEQYHMRWVVVDRTSKILDVEAGIGFGMTSGTDKVTLKLMLSRDIRKPKEPSDNDITPNRQGGLGNP